MQNYPGIFIVLEGADGSGKGTQFQLLKERLRAAGYDVAVFDFPRYDQPSSYFVQRYLNGAYGSAVKMSPYVSSLFYALDRFEAAPDIRRALDEGKIVLSNRYVGSNMAHQGSKFSNSIEQRGFFIWEDNLEFEMLGIPRPTINIFLRVPAEISYELIKRKAARSYTSRARDEHEADLGHLKRSIGTYDTLCRLFPKDFKAIDCTNDGELMDIPAINNLIWREIKHLLPDNPPHPGRSVTVQLEALSKPAANPQPAKPEQTPVKMPIISTGRAQVNGKALSLKAEDISLLAASFIKTAPAIDVKLTGAWSALPGRQAGGKRKLEFYTPPELSPKEAMNFNRKMDGLAAAHKSLHRELVNLLGAEKSASAKKEIDVASLGRQASEILSPTIPMAALVSADISGTPQAISGLVFRLLTSRMAETHKLGLNFYETCNKRYPSEFKEFDELAQSAGQTPGKAGSVIAHLSAERLPQTLPDVSEPVRLTTAEPRNEMSLLADIIYPHSSLSRADIDQEVEGWSYEQKAGAMEAALNDGTAAPALALTRYRWDIISDWPSLDELIGAGCLADLQLQPYSPRYGFSTPAAIEAAALDDKYAECFDASLSLFSDLQGGGTPTAADYAVLLGHKLRWEAATDWPALAATISGLPGNTIVKQMKELAAEAHPLLSTAFEQKKVSKPAKAQAKTPKKPHKPQKRSRRRGRKPKKP